MGVSPDPQPPAPGAESDVQFIARVARWAIVAALALGLGLALLWILKGALTPLAISFAIAYVLDPLIDRLEEVGVPRRLAILLLIGSLAATLVIGLLFVVPKLQDDIAALIERLPGYLEQVQTQLLPEIERRLGVPLPTVSELIERMRSGDVPLPFAGIRGFLTGALGYVTGTVSVVLGALVIPILAYYALLEFDRMMAAIGANIPPRYRSYAVERAHTIDRLVAGFLRGQLLVATLLGVLYAVGFTVIGIDLAIGVGLLAGALALIPYLGNIVAVTVASLLCVLKFGFDGHLLAVLGWYAIVQNLEGFVLTPRIIGQSVGLHPAAVIVALLIGGDLFGFLGLLIAVPAAASIKVFADDLLASYRESLRDTAPVHPAAPGPGPGSGEGI
jgi:predicted PurR-regulated permease PerM